MDQSLNKDTFNVLMKFMLGKPAVGNTKHDAYSFNETVEGWLGLSRLATRL